MTKEQTRIVKNYHKELRGCFPVFSKSEKKLSSGIKESIDEYIAENPQFTRESLVGNIGEPKEIVARYLSDIDTDTLYKAIAYSKKIRILIYAILAIALALAATRIYLDYRSYVKTRESYINREIHTIDEGGDIDGGEVYEK